MNTSYADFKRYYESLSTEQLLQIAATSDLVPEAAAAMKSELQTRKLEIEREKYEVYVGPTAPPPPKYVHLWLHVAIALLSAAAAFVVWAWQAIAAWFRQ